VILYPNKLKVMLNERNRTKTLDVMVLSIEFCFFSVFPDPMLNSDSNSLMGTVNDVNSDKTHTDDIMVKLD